VGSFFPLSLLRFHFLAICCATVAHTTGAANAACIMSAIHLMQVLLDHGPGALDEQKKLGS
jgi:hypothetical protein